MDSVQEIYGLRYDFVYLNGLVMKLHRNEGIYAQELSDIQLRMMESNPIPKLLPIEVQETDFQISLLYQLQSKRMLSQVLKTDGLTKAQFIKLTFTILCAVDQSGNYMLNASQYLLQEKFIFIGSELTDVYLTYLPFQQLVGEIPLYSQVGMLIERLIRIVKPEEREGLDELLKLCTEDFNLPAFKQELLDRMGKPVKQDDILPYSPMPMPKPLFQKESGLEQQQFSEPEKKQFSESPPKHSNKLLGDAGIPIFEKNNRFLLTERSRFIALAAILFVLAFIWKSYLDHPNNIKLYMDSGISLLLIDVWILFGFIGIAITMRWTELVNLKGRKIVVYQDSEPKLQVNIQDYYRNLHNLTTLLSDAPSQATVFLGKSQTSGESPLLARTAMIEVSKDGGKKQIPMTGNSFTIGRGEEDCSYGEHEAGLSRLHAEIFKALEGYGVKDLGSKNGTLLNDEPLVPYQSYPVKDGDIIRILKTEFRIVSKN